MTDTKHPNRSYRDGKRTETAKRRALARRQWRALRRARRNHG